MVIYIAGGQNPALPASSMPKWGPRPLKFPPRPEEEVLDILRPHGDIHVGLLTVRKEEHKAWKRELVRQAGERSWASYRELKTQRRPNKSWEARITDDPEWKTQLLEHFRSIFAKADPIGVRQRAKELHDQLSVKCKATPWHPFREDELRPIMAKWKNNKSTGTDRISLEAVRYISLVRGGLGRLLWLLNDILYVGKLPPGLNDGLAVLLPKVAAPQEFADTRPITLSNILLKTLAQLLLLRRGLPLLRPIGNLQFCKTGSQSVELILALRRLAQQAHEWRETFWIIKLDVRKAFDSISQQYLSTLVAEKVRDRLPWEARAWLQVLGARAGSGLSGGLWRRNPRRRPDKRGQTRLPGFPIALLRGDRGGHRPSHPGHGGDRRLGRPPPTATFMDDTYVWGANPTWIQQCLEAVVRRFAERGLEINPKKTMVVCSAENGGSFRIGNQTVPSQGPDAIMTALGSPVTFINAPAAIIGEMQHRARKSFNANRQLLCCKEAKLDDRLHSPITQQPSTGRFLDCPEPTTHEPSGRYSSSGEQPPGH